MIDKEKEIIEIVPRLHLTRDEPLDSSLNIVSVLLQGLHGVFFEEAHRYQRVRVLIGREVVDEVFHRFPLRLIECDASLDLSCQH